MIPFLLLFICINVLIKSEVATLSFVHTQVENGVKVTVTETSTPQVDWSTFTSLVVTDCSGGITWTLDGADLYHVFTHTEIIACGFSDVAEEYTYVKPFEFSFVYGSFIFRDFYDLELVVDPESNVVIGGAAEHHQVVADELEKLEVGATVTRVTSGYEAWTDEPNRWIFTKGSNVYWKVTGNDVAFINVDTVYVELRSAAETAGMNVSEFETVTTSFVTDHVRVSFPVPSEQNMGNLKYIYFSFDIVSDRRDIEEGDTIYAWYLFHWGPVNEDMIWVIISLTFVLLFTGFAVVVLVLFFKSLQNRKKNKLLGN